MSVQCAIHLAGSSVVQDSCYRQFILESVRHIAHCTSATNHFPTINFENNFSASESSHAGFVRDNKCTLKISTVLFSCVCTTFHSTVIVKIRIFSSGFLTSFVSICDFAYPPLCHPVRRKKSISMKGERQRSFRLNTPKQNVRSVLSTQGHQNLNEECTSVRV